MAKIALPKRAVKDTPSELNGEASAAKPMRPPFTLKPSKKTCTVLGGLAGAVLLATVGLFVWQNGEIAAVQSVVAEKQQEVASGEKVAQKLVQVEAEYSTMQNQLRFLETSVTASEYVPTLLKQTEGLAKSVSLKVASVRPTLEPAPQPPTDPEARKKFKPQAYDKIHIDMEVSGGYWNVAKMLYRLTEFPKILAVESVQVTPATTSAVAITSSPELSVKLKLTGFIFPNDGHPLDAPIPALPSAGGTPPPKSAAIAVPSAPKVSTSSAAPVVTGSVSSMHTAKI